MIRQLTIELQPMARGFHLITSEVEHHLGALPEKGLLHLMILHTSAGLCVNENADPSVRTDFELYYDRLAPENLPGLTHTLEGPDDMPAHIKASLCGNDVTIPIKNGKLFLGVWQGIYLCEFRNRPRARSLFATLFS